MKTFSSLEELKQHYIEVQKRLNAAALTSEVTWQEEARRRRLEEIARERRDREARERAMLESKAEQERAAEWLRTVVAGQDEPFVPPKAILYGVARKYGLLMEELCRPRGKAIYDYVRFEAMYLMHLRKFSSPMIGRALNRDHTTILAGVRRYKQLMEQGEVENYGQKRDQLNATDGEELPVSDSVSG